MNHFQRKPENVSQFGANNASAKSIPLPNSRPLREVVKGATTSHYENAEIGRSNGTSSHDPAVTEDAKTVLVVDDDILVNELTSQLLQRFGYSVCTAFSGEEALGLYRGQNESIDLIMLDLSMPGMGGYDCLCELKRLDPSVRVIITSGYSDDEKKHETLQAGAAGFVGKPYQAADLLKTVKNVLEVK